MERVKTCECVERGTVYVGFKSLTKVEQAAIARHFQLRRIAL